MKYRRGAGKKSSEAEARQGRGAVGQRNSRAEGAVGQRNSRTGAKEEGKQGSRTRGQLLEYSEHLEEKLVQLKVIPKQKLIKIYKSPEV